MVRQDFINLVPVVDEDHKDEEEKSCDKSGLIMDPPIIRICSSPSMRKHSTHSASISEEQVQQFPIRLEVKDPPSSLLQCQMEAKPKQSFEKAIDGNAEAER